MRALTVEDIIVRDQEQRILGTPARAIPPDSVPRVRTGATGGGRGVSEETRAEIRRLSGLGMSCRQIARYLKVSLPTARRWAQREVA